MKLKECSYKVIYKNTPQTKQNSDNINVIKK